MNTEDKKKSHPVAQSIGRNYPIVQINDMQLISDDIEYCEIAVQDFLPTLTLRCNFRHTNFLKMNLPKDGDLVSVFMRPMNDFYVPIHCDFVIKQVSTTTYVVRNDPQYKVAIKGELFIPNIRKRGVQRVFPGYTSIDVIKKIAEDFNLGFSVSDTDQTQDKQIWYQAGESTYDFIKNVTDHAWKDDTAFYDSWVDQYYNLTFSNQNKILGTSKDEDGILDIANQVIITSRALHDKLNEDGNTQEENPKELPRVFTNLKGAQYSNQFIEGYSVDSQSTKISEECGHVIDLTYNVNNQALFKSGNPTVQKIIIEPAYNKDKIYDHVLLRGRSRDGYNNKETMQDFADYSQETIVNYIWGGNVQSMSDDDPLDSAIGRSGNSYKQYTRAFYHNVLNRKEIEKIVLNLEVKGLNTGVLKGEKIAVLNVEYDQAGSILNAPLTGIGENKEIGLIDMFYSGWFIVTGLKFVYDKSIKYTGLNNQQEGLFYKTIISCSRREWIPPETVSPVAFDNDGNLIRKPYGSTQYPAPSDSNRGLNSSRIGQTNIVSSPGAPSKSKNDFVKRYLNNALEVERNTGLSADYILARAALETGWGRSVKGNNFFGVKGKGPSGKSITVTTREHLSYPPKGKVIKSSKPLGNGKTEYVIEDDFAVYDSPAESFVEHYNFLERNKRYSNALQFKSDPFKFAQHVNSAGYSTDVAATQKLHNIIASIQQERRILDSHA